MAVYPSCSSVKTHLYQNFCLFYSQLFLPMLHDWQGWLHSDYMKYRSNLTDQQAQRQTGTVAGDSSLPEGEIYTQKQRQKQGKNDTRCNNCTPFMSHRATQSMKNYANRSSGNTYRMDEALEECEGVISITDDVCVYTGKEKQTNMTSFT